MTDSDAKNMAGGGAGRKISPQTRDIQEEIINQASAGFQSLPMLDIIFKRMATGIASTFKSRAGMIAEVTFDGITYANWGNLSLDVDPFGICAIASARPWGGTLAVTIDRNLLFATLESQMGGSPMPGAAPDRPASIIEQQVMRHTVDLILTELSQNFSRVTEAAFSIDSMEPPQQMSAIHGAASPCVMARVNVVVGGCEGFFDIIIPFSTLDPVQDKLLKMFLGKKLGADTTWREHIVQNITGSNVMVSARIHEMKIPMLNILNWAPGSVIDLGILPDQEITLICSGIPVMHGRAGRVGSGKMALRITREEDSFTSKDVLDDLNGEILQGGAV